METSGLLSSNTLSQETENPFIGNVSITPQELKNLENLALSHYNNGNYKGCEAVLTIIYNHKIQSYGENHIESLQTLNNIAASQGRQGKYEEAERNFKKVLEEKERNLGSDHPETLITINHLGVLLKKMNRIEEAEEHISKAYTGFKNTLGETNRNTSESAYNYALINVQLGKRLKAHRLFKQAHVGLSQSLGVDHPHTIDALHWQVKCSKLESPTNNTSEITEIEEQDFYHTRKDWQNSLVCEICFTKFGYFKRQHHCRICSLSVCNSCSQFRTIVLEYDPKIPVRICLVCEQQGF